MHTSLTRTKSNLIFFFNFSPRVLEIKENVTYDNKHLIYLLIISIFLESSALWSQITGCFWGDELSSYVQCRQCLLFGKPSRIRRFFHSYRFIPFQLPQDGRRRHLNCKLILVYLCWIDLSYMVFDVFLFWI